MAFVREIGRNGVIYFKGIWPRHRVSNQNKGISNDIPINNCALQACYGISNRKIYQLIESIKFHINDITSNPGMTDFKDKGQRGTYTRMIIKMIEFADEDASGFDLPMGIRHLILLFGPLDFSDYEPDIAFIIRPKKRNCLFPVTVRKKIG